MCREVTANGVGDVDIAAAASYPTAPICIHPSSATLESAVVAFCILRVGVAVLFVGRILKCFNFTTLHEFYCWHSARRTSTAQNTPSIALLGLLTSKALSTRSKNMYVRKHTLTQLNRPT